MARSSLRNPGKALLVVIDATAKDADRFYEEGVRSGAVMVVHGDAPWAAPADLLDPGSAAYLSLYADLVIGGGLPAALS